MTPPLSPLRHLGSATLLLALLPAFLVWTPIASAQDLTTEECLSDVHNALAREQRLFRIVVFGQKSTSNTPPDSLRYDTFGRAWLKTEPNVWKSLASGSDQAPWDDSQMQQNMEVDPACQSSNTTMQQLCVRSTRRGLLEVLKAPTSELIPPLVQSLRALQCRLRAVCMAGRASQNPKAGATVSVQPEGCLALEFPTFQGCKLKDQTFADVKGGNCEKTVDVILDQEINLLHLAVGYDAAYRSLYQFGGMFEDAMREFRFPILTPIWQAVRALSNIAGLPCFLSQCEE